MPEDLQRPLPELYNAISTAAESIRYKSAQKYGPLSNAYMDIGDLLSSLIDQGTENPTTVTESASQRISLTASLLQTTTIVEEIISCGFYWAASALLRQHMEALARVIHIRNGKPATDQRPPHVKVLPFRLSQNHGRLSELVHVASGELLRDFSLSASGEEIATPLPIYREEWSKDLLAVHIAHMIVLATEIHILHYELYPKKDLLEPDGILQRVVTILANEGFWKENVLG